MRVVVAKGCFFVEEDRRVCFFDPLVPAVVDGVLILASIDGHHHWVDHVKGLDEWGKQLGAIVSLAVLKLV